MPVAGNWFGTTLRLYDPAIKGWRIYWLDPATNGTSRQFHRWATVKLLLPPRRAGGLPWYARRATSIAWRFSSRVSHICGPGSPNEVANPAIRQMLMHARAPASGSWPKDLAK